MCTIVTHVAASNTSPASVPIRSAHRVGGGSPGKPRTVSAPRAGSGCRDASAGRAAALRSVSARPRDLVRASAARPLELVSRAAPPRGRAAPDSLPAPRARQLAANVTVRTKKPPRSPVKRLRASPVKKLAR